jgi:peptidoglycan hydrolase-like protein with peptidoglycan-binding domain
MLQSSLFSPSQDLADVADGKRRIMAPESSDSVLRIQEALILAGFSLADSGVDGSFGSETGDAVTAFVRFLTKREAPADGAPLVEVRANTVSGERAPQPRPEELGLVDESTDLIRGSRGRSRAAPGSERCSRPCGWLRQKERRNGRSRPRMRSATAGAANHEPTTKRMIGPKLRAAGEPTKWSPATEDSRPRPSTGWPSSSRSRARIAASRNG